MIHAVDLSTIVKYLCHETPEDLEYINAVDFSNNRSQSKLVQTISEALGGIEILQMTYLDSVFADDYNILTLNVNLMPTDVLQSTTEESPANNGVQLTFGEGEKKVYKWKYRNGFCDNFDQIYEEFKMFRNLKTIKLGIIGMGSSGPCMYGEDLAKKIKVPYISYESLVADVLKRDDVMGKQVKEFLDNEKSRMVREATEELEKQKAKKKKGLPDSINPDEYVPKLNLQMITEIFSWRLNKSDCKNKGYVLEGYPTTKQEAFDLFIDRIPIKNEIVPVMEAEAENSLELQQANQSKSDVDKSKIATGQPGNQSVAAVPGDQNYKLIPKTSIMPDKVVYLTADTGADFYQHMKDIYTEEQLLEMKITPESVDTKFLEWQQKVGTEANSILDFYKEYKIEIITSNVKGIESKDKIINQVGEKIDLNFKDSGFEDEPSQETLLANSRLVEEKPDIPDKKPQNNNYDHMNLSMEDIKQREQELLNQKSQALKQYITDNLLPALTSGLIDICNTKPDDPLDSLADYLIQLSQKKSS